jgi:hypothetical protein
MKNKNITHTLTSKIETPECEAVYIKTNDDNGDWFNIEMLDDTLFLPKSIIPSLKEALDKQLQA